LASGHRRVSHGLSSATLLASASLCTVLVAHRLLKLTVPYTGWDEDVATKRGWLGHWLASTVLIEPPQVVQESSPTSTLATARSGRPGIGQATPVAELMARVRERRQELKLSQALVAAALGVTQSYFSKLERGAAGDKQISADLKQRLIDWLGEH